MPSSTSPTIRPQEPSRQVGPASEIREARHTPRILIVEDEFLIALELENRLLDAGFQVVGVATSASEVTALAKSENPDLVIMDIRLGGRKDGVDAAIELYTALGIRSIFASAHADQDTRKRAAQASPVGWVQKPYGTDDLVRVIRGHLA